MGRARQFLLGEENRFAHLDVEPDHRKSADQLARSRRRPCRPAMGQGGPAQHLDLQRGERRTARPADHPPRDRPGHDDPLRRSPHADRGGHPHPHRGSARHAVRQHDTIRRQRDSARHAVHHGRRIAHPQRHRRGRAEPAQAACRGRAHQHPHRGHASRRDRDRGRRSAHGRARPEPCRRLRGRRDRRARHARLPATLGSHQIRRRMALHATGRTLRRQRPRRQVHGGASGAAAAAHCRSQHARARHRRCRPVHRLQPASLGGRRSGDAGGRYAAYPPRRAAPGRGAQEFRRQGRLARAHGARREPAGLEHHARSRSERPTAQAQSAQFLDGARHHQFGHHDQRAPRSRLHRVRHPPLAYADGRAARRVRRRAIGHQRHLEGARADDRIGQQRA